MYGEGEIRIGKTIELSDDIYCLGFICQISDTIMDKHIDIEKEKLDRADVIRKKAIRHHAIKVKKAAKVKNQD